MQTFVAQISSKYYVKIGSTSKKKKQCPYYKEKLVYIVWGNNCG